jgi:ketosteroid isomerase-like protein
MPDKLPTCRGFQSTATPRAAESWQPVGHQFCKLPAKRKEQAMKRIAFSLILALTIPVIILAQEKAGQSKDEQELLKTRSEWYDAYFRGDTATLERIETSDFVVISDRTVENKRTYTGIQNAVKANRWMPKGTTKVDDDDLRVRLQGDFAAISGRGWNKVPGVFEKPPQNRIAFTEIWVRRDGRWRVMHLHYHLQVQPQPPSSAQSQPAALAQGQPAFPVGTYAAKDQMGAWLISFQSDGTYTVKLDDQLLVPDGRYTVSSNGQVVLSSATPSAMCSGNGTYKWSSDEKALTFEAVSDTACQPRLSVLTGNKFIRQP